MVPTQQKDMASLNFAPTTTDTAAQTELWWEHAATPVSGGGVCPALVPVSDSSEHTCGRCAQVEELLCLVIIALGGGWGVSGSAREGQTI